MITIISLNQHRGIKGDCAPHLDDIAGEVQVCQGVEGELVGHEGGGHGVDSLAAEAAVGEVEVLGASGQVTHHLGDVGQPLVLNKIYAEK